MFSTGRCEPVDEYEFVLVVFSIGGQPLIWINQRMPMSFVEIHAVQPFVRTAKGRITNAAIQTCASPEKAKRLAEQMVENGKAVGALAYTRSGDDDDNLFGDPTFLARVGNVPEHDDY